MIVNDFQIKVERIAKGLTRDEKAKDLSQSDRSRYAKCENDLVSFDADELIKVVTMVRLVLSIKRTMNTILNTTFSINGN